MITENEMRDFGQKMVDMVVDHSSLSSKVAELTAKVNELTNGYEWYKSNNERNIAQIDALVSERNQLRDRNTLLAKETSDLYEALQNMENRAVAAEHLAQKNLERCDTLSYDLSEARSSRQGLIEANDKFAADLDTAHKQMDDKDRQIQSLREQTVYIIGDRDHYRQCYNDAEYKLREANDKLNALHDTVNKLKAVFDPPQAEPTYPHAVASPF
jgi:chromosome segregation ATPase